MFDNVSSCITFALKLVYTSIGFVISSVKFYKNHFFLWYFIVSVKWIIQLKNHRTSFKKNHLLHHSLCLDSIIAWLLLMLHQVPLSLLYNPLSITSRALHFLFTKLSSFWMCQYPIVWHSALVIQWLCIPLLRLAYVEQEPYND